MSLDARFSAAIANKSLADPILDPVGLFFARWLLHYLVSLGILYFLLFDSFIPGMQTLPIIMMFAALILGYGATFVISTLVRRPRPYEGISEPQYKPFLKTYSFPSGHSSAAFSVAWSFLFSYVLFGSGISILLPILGLIMAACVAMGRVMIGVHYLSDIIAGMIVALLANIIVYYLLWQFAELTIR